MAKKTPPTEEPASEAAPTPDPVEELRAVHGDQVTLYPTGHAWIRGIPAEVTTVPVERAAELLAFQPPAFTTDAPTEAAATPEAGPETFVPPTDGVVTREIIESTPQPADAGDTTQEV